MKQLFLKSIFVVGTMFALAGYSNAEIIYKDFEYYLSNVENTNSITSYTTCPASGDALYALDWGNQLNGKPMNDAVCPAGAKCPVGIAWRDGQCTYDAMTTIQKSNDDCVKLMRERKLQVLMEKPSPSGTGTVCPAKPETTKEIRPYEILISEIRRLNKQVRIILSKNKNLQKLPIATLKKLIEQAVLDPIDLSNGNFEHEDQLFVFPGNGLKANFGIAYQALYPSEGPVGNNWTHSAEISMQPQTDGSLLYHAGNFKVFELTKDGGNRSNPTFNITATKQSDGTYLVKFLNGDQQFFNENGQITLWKNKNNQQLSYTYNADNQLTTLADSQSHVLEFTYYEHRRVESITDNAGRSVKFVYYEDETAGNESDLKTITITSQGESKSQTYTYQKKNSLEASSLLLTIADAKNQTYLVNTFDAEGRVTSQMNGEGKNTYSYQLNGERVTKTTVTNRKGVVTEFEYDGKGNQKSINVLGENALKYGYEYDSKNNLIKEIFPAGDGMKYTYNANNVLTSEIQVSKNGAERVQAEYTYDSNDRLSSTRSKGITISYTYDERNNIMMITQKNTEGKVRSASFVYDAVGNLTSVTAPDGQVTTYTYENGLPVTITTTGKAGTTQTRRMSYDFYGNPLTITDSLGNKTTVEYNGFDQIIKETSPESIVKQFSYDATNSLTQAKTILENGQSATMNYSYDTLDDLVAVSSDRGQGLGALQTTFAYDLNKNITQNVLPNGTKVSYTYDSLDRLVAKTITTKEGVSTTTKLEYDANSQLVRSIDAKGNAITYTYDDFGRVISLTDSLGTKSLITWSLSGIEVPISQKITNSSNQLLSHTEISYDGWGQVVSQTQFDVTNNQVYTKQVVEYDANGKVIKTYQISSQSATPAQMTQYVYDEFGRVQTITDQLGNKKTFTYDLNNQLVSEITEGGGVVSDRTSYKYDKNGRVISTTNNEHSTTYFYNALDQIVKIVDANGNKTEYTYDFLGNVIAQIQYDGTTPVVTKYTYDELGNVTTLTDPNGNEHTFSYDGLGNLVNETYPDGSVVAYTYDENSNLTSRKDANGTTVSQTFDALNRLTQRDIQRGQNVLGTTKETYEYDGLGRLIKGNDDTNQTVGFAYDGMGRLKEETQGTQKVGYAYDLNNNLTQLTYPSGKKVSKSYDALNRLQKISDGSDIAAYTYKGLDLQKIAYGNGTATEFSYNQRHQIGSISYTNTQLPKTELTYNATDTIITENQNVYTYDGLYRLLGTSQGDAYTYDAAGNRTSSTPTDASLSNGGNGANGGENGECGKGLHLGRYIGKGNLKNDLKVDPKGSMKQMVQDWKKFHECRRAKLKALIDERKSKKEGNNNNNNQGNNSNNNNDENENNGNSNNGNGNNGNGNGNGGNNNGNKGFKLFGKLKEVIEKVKDRHCEVLKKVDDKISSTPNNNLPFNGKFKEKFQEGIKKQEEKFCNDNESSSSESGSQGNGNGQGQGQDNENEEDENNNSEENESDEETSQPEIEGLTSYQINGLNQYEKADKKTYTYDKNGNLLSDGDLSPGGEKTFFYDYQNRLVKVTDKSGKIVLENTYDLLGRRTSKKASGKTTSYLYSNQDIIQETEGSNKKEYVYGMGIDDVIGMSMNGKKYWYMKDIRGSVIALTDSNKKIVEKYEYDARGNVKSLPKNGINTRLYTARERDAEVGLYFYRARYYSATLGRFIQRDPIGYSDNVNLYAYVGNNPVNWVDPMGLNKNKGIIDGIRNNPGLDKLGKLSAMRNAGVLDTRIGQVLEYCKNNLGECGEGYSKELLNNGSEILYAQQEIIKECLGGVPECMINATPIGDGVMLADYWKEYDTMSDAERKIKGGYVMLMLFSYNSKALKGKVDDLAKMIANGHALTKHIGEFESIGIKTAKDLENHIISVIKKTNGTNNMKSLERGRSAYWDDYTDTLVIIDPKNIDGGTVYKPSKGKDYFNTLK